MRLICRFNIFKFIWNLIFFSSSSLYKRLKLKKKKFSACSWFQFWVWVHWVGERESLLVTWLWTPKKFYRQVSHPRHSKTALCMVLRLTVGLAPMAPNDTLAMCIFLSKLELYKYIHIFLSPFPVNSACLLVNYFNHSIKDDLL